MNAAPIGNAGLTIALALLAGMLAQALAWHLSMPGIVVLLIVGVLLGPEVAGVIEPDVLGPALLTLVGFAVAIVLFEGGMKLELSRLRRLARPIRRLITLGALTTTVGGTLAARFVLGWDWRPSVLFGTLVIVTGPTVITPLLRKLKVEHKAATVLEAEGIFGDAVGAVVAVVALEVALSQIETATLAQAAGHVLTRLLAGAAMGAVGGFVLVWLLRLGNTVPRGLENVFTLALVLALFQAANAVMPESGIAAAIAAGMVVGNLPTYGARRLHDFKEQLTVLVIGMLFVLLAADVELDRVERLGWGGVLTVAILMFVVRPLGVALSTRGSRLGWRRKAFIAWIGPRGIVAAAIAAFFSAELSTSDMVGAREMREMVFLVIAVTVLMAGLSGGLAARLLGLNRPQNVGWVILGANGLGRALAGALKRCGEEVVCIDANPELARAAEEQGFRVLFGNGLEERTLRRAELDIRAGFIGATPNDEVNLLFAQKIREERRNVRVLVGLDSIDQGVTAEMVHAVAAAVLFGTSHDCVRWSDRFDRQAARVEDWQYPGHPEAQRGRKPHLERPREEDRAVLLPLVLVRRGRVLPFGDDLRFEPGDHVTFAVLRERADEAAALLGSRGFRPAEDGPAIQRDRASSGPPPWRPAALPKPSPKAP